MHMQLDLLLTLVLLPIRRAQTLEARIDKHTLQSGIERHIEVIRELPSIKAEGK